MEIRIESRQLDDICILVPQVFQDDRGFLAEVFRADQFNTLGLPTEFVQDNHSGSRKQISPPAGFARGFCTLSDFAEIQ